MTNRTLLILLLASIVAGCGAGNPTSTKTATGPRSDVSAAYAYARCMRGHGVPNFPDPKVKISPGHGSVSFTVNPSETGSPKFGSAQKKCSGILPAPASPARQRAEEQAHKRTLLAFARCLRANGVRDFPDPDERGHLTLQVVAAAGVDVRSRTFLNAAKTCVGVTHGDITMQQIEAGINGNQ
jgi:hypothetical protein